MLVGAGGAGRRRWATALLEQGAEHVAVLDADRGPRRRRAPTRLAKRFGDDRVSAVTDLAAALADAQGLVNATPIGMLGHAGIAGAGARCCATDLWVSDVVYFPLETELVACGPRTRLPGARRAAAWPCTRRSARSSTSPAGSPDAARMSRHFAS